MRQKVIATEITHDVGYDDQGDLPSKISFLIDPEKLTTDEQIEEFLSEAISEHTGFCHDGFHWHRGEVYEGDPQPFTVIAIESGSAGTRSIHVDAYNTPGAFRAAAQKHPGYDFVAAIRGSLAEPDGDIGFAGESLVDGHTILAQADVFTD